MIVPVGLMVDRRHHGTKNKKGMAMLLREGTLYDPDRLPDIYGSLVALESLPGGFVRGVFCEQRGGVQFRVVSKLVVSGHELMVVRPCIGRWLSAHGFGQHPPIIIH